MKKILVFLAFIIFITSNTGNAAYISSGNELLRYCKKAVNLDPKKDNIADLVKAIKCHVFISGIIEGHNYSSVISAAKAGKISGKEINYKNVMAFCVDNKKIPIMQTTRVVLKHLENNPEFLHLNASLLIITALSKAFPCRNKK